MMQFWPLYIDWNMSLKNSICEDITFIYKYFYDFFIDLINVLFNKYVITAYSLTYIQL